MSLFLNKKDSREENLCFLPESDDLKKKKKDITKCTHPNVFIIIIGAGDWLGFKENEVKVIHKGPLQKKKKKQKQDTRQK